ncbi:MAG: hypothetical protein N2109_01700 [Fimbriimonadales bacterium]|nr:hypothetical protein [Fimbriimonadales bacterium]
MNVGFEEHNEEVRRVWEAYRRGSPFRVPVVLGINVRFTMFDRPANPRGTTFRQYFEEPLTMLQRQLEHLEFVRFHVPADHEMGLPDEWSVSVDFQNVYEAASFGCPLRFLDGQVPDTQPILEDDRKRMLFDAGLPEPFQTEFERRMWEFHDVFQEERRKGRTFRGRPIRVDPPSGLGTDGPMTVCANLRGATEFCIDLMEDPVYAEQLLDFVTEAIGNRIEAYRRRLGIPAKQQGFSWADDSIALLSEEQYREFVLPRHRRLVERLSSGGPNGIHLCGDATRHFRLLRDELNVRSFDTGFPVDFARLRRDLGPDVEILGGPTAMLLRDGTPSEVAAETRRILGSGILQGGRFILREANNLAPGTPLSNIAAMYETARQWGLGAA